MGEKREEVKKHRLAAGNRQDYPALREQLRVEEMLPRPARRPCARPAPDRPAPLSPLPRPLNAAPRPGGGQAAPSCDAFPAPGARGRGGASLSDPPPAPPPRENQPARHRQRRQRYTAGDQPPTRSRRRTAGGLVVAEQGRLQPAVLERQ